MLSQKCTFTQTKTIPISELKKGDVIILADSNRVAVTRVNEIAKNALYIIHYQYINLVESEPTTAFKTYVGHLIEIIGRCDYES